MIGILLLIGAILFGGGLVVFLKKLNSQKAIKFFLAVSGGFLLSIAFIHFIPEMYAHQNDKIGYFILLGFLVQLFLEYFSGGIEHGHIHSSNHYGSLPWALFIALSIHAFLEGIPLQYLIGGQLAVGEHSHLFSDGDHGLLIGIVLHKIPVAIALMTLLLSSGFKEGKAWVVLFVFSLMAPFGMLVGKWDLLGDFISLDVILAIVVGMFLHISTTIIFESSENHRFNYGKLISILVGVGLGIILI